MNFVQDPMRQVAYLQQCLSSNKKPLGVFLGAGCPVAIRINDADGHSVPLIPDIAGITETIQTELSKSTECGPLLKIVQDHFKHDGRQNATVEDVLSHIRALHIVAGKATARDLSCDQLEKLDDAICDLIRDLANKTLPDSSTPYHRLAAWVDSIGRETPVELFTTNYDVLMEQALEDCRVPYFDGFAGGRTPFFDLRAMEEDVLPPRWARLWKLHGSINWYQIPGQGVFRGAVATTQTAKRVIHPSHLKYEESRRMPYLAMIDRLRAFLKCPTTTLVLCGYSFRDEHLNEVIIQGLQATQTAIAFALLYGELRDYPQASALARSRTNLTLLARDGGIIGGQECKWPEKDADAVSSDNGKWIKWTPIDPANDNDKHTAEFTLGDFTVLGQFLQELIGSVQQTQEVPDAQ